MSPTLIIGIVAAYFVVLILISFLTGKEDTNESFFLGKRQSPWFVVAFGMIGASLSGVTFISVPGWVDAKQFSYMQTVLGYLVGYGVIGTVLLPLYYRLQLTSIYTYLEQRFGFWSYKTGAAYFLISRILGASCRLYLVAIVLQSQVFNRLGMEVPFVVTVIITIALIWLYTFRAGIKTIIWTDTLQTLFMLLSVGFTVWLIGQSLGMDLGGIIDRVADSDYSQVFFFGDWNDGRHFIKQFVGGAFIAIAMTGLDQDMMQKNLSCKSLKDAQKNMFWFSTVLVVVNLVFLGLGALLYIFASQNGIAMPEKADHLFPMIALGGYLDPIVGILFILGLIAAAYSSADSALTSLTTSFCVDFLDIGKKADRKQVVTRKAVHIGMSAVLVVVILIINSLSSNSIIGELFYVASLTYGPLLGLYAFGLFTRLNVQDHLVPLVCIVAPLSCFLLDRFSVELFNGYEFSFELLPINGFLTFVGLLIISTKQQNKADVLDVAQAA